MINNYAIDVRFSGSDDDIHLSVEFNQYLKDECGIVLATDALLYGWFKDDHERLFVIERTLTSEQFDAIKVKAVELGAKVRFKIWPA